MELQRQINKPEYFFRPMQLLRRILYKNRGRKKVPAAIDRSGIEFFVNENEVIGHSIMTMGVYDLVVAEAMARILQPGSQFVDVGANIGYFSRQAIQMGANVDSYEPHPGLVKRLRENILGFPNIKVLEKAVSKENGSFVLYIPSDFAMNEGTASLEPIPDAEEIPVEVVTLDSMGYETIDLLKVDVEGHENAVFEGAKGLLSEKRIKNIIFEDFRAGSSLAMGLLKSLDYQVMGLKKTLFGPKLVSIQEMAEMPLWEPPNYIAFADEKATRKLFRSFGWRFLR